MNPAAVLDQARAAGVVVRAKGDRLRYSGPEDAVAVVLPLLKAHKPALLRLLQPKLMTLLTAACEGTDLSPDTFRSLLSPEDLADIEASDIPVETLHAYAQSFAEGIRSGRVVPIRDDTTTATSTPP